MTFASFAYSRYLRVLAAASLSLLSTCTVATGGGQPIAGSAVARGEEPIAYIGHGALFDRSGLEIVPTADWVEQAQAWYRRQLLPGLTDNRKRALAIFEGRLGEGLSLEGQSRLVVQQRSLEWIAANSPRARGDRALIGRLSALSERLRRRLADQDSPAALREFAPFRLDPRLVERLARPEFNAGGPLFLATMNRGQQYIDECITAEVPIPPPINRMAPANNPGWTSLGFIPTDNQFIIRTPAEVRVFRGTTGLCISLPRYTDDALSAINPDGVICLSETTSKVCFWDNRMDDSTALSGSRVFEILPGEEIPIGVADTSVDPQGRYQGGGAELEGFDVCTDCHAGENPYIIHPNVELLDPPSGSSTVFTPNGVRMRDFNGTLNLPTFGPNRYIPLVPASWPQNDLSHADALVPAAGCRGCHSAGSSAGRFPHLALGLDGMLTGYCGTVLRNAVAGTPGAMPTPIPPTMPQYAEGTLATNAAVTTFRNWCNTLATAGPSTRGEPHLTTTNGINYDFQAAGEFTALRNSSNGFELQTRQTPILISFTPGADGYTGLASCVSMNTAVAVRVGRHRISYQPSADRPTGVEQMQLRIDGAPVTLSASGVNLGGGNRIAEVAGGGLDISVADGTRLIVTPYYWASEGYWMLNIEVLNTPAREGTMGHIMAPDWLPVRPDGTSFGTAPGTLPDRHALLNGVFADAWRVTNATSLFDYAPGTSTANYTSRAWPPAPGATCAALPVFPWPNRPPGRPVQPMNPLLAQRLCRPIGDQATYGNCVFDLTVTGDAGMAGAYLRTLRLRALAAPQSWPIREGSSDRAADRE